MGTNVRPVRTAAFYEMIAALIVLIAVLVEALCATNGNALRLFMYAVAVGAALYSAIAVRQGRQELPVLTTGDIITSDKECRLIQTWAGISLLGTLVGAANIVTLIEIHRLPASWIPAVFVAFNVHGWFALRWWREARTISACYKQARETIPEAPSVSVTPVVSVQPTSTEPLPLRVGMSHRS